jgi:inhibitor of cysteine peptidase
MSDDVRNTITLTGPAKDQHSTIGRNDVVVIKLQENPTTGYRWAVEAIDDDVLKLEGSDFSAAPDTGVGGGGQRTFTFTPRKAGATGRVRLKLAREWEADRSGIDHYELTITVADRV